MTITKARCPVCGVVVAACMYTLVPAWWPSAVRSKRTVTVLVRHRAFAWWPWCPHPQPQQGGHKPVALLLYMLRGYWLKFKK